jgi:drug/metabolite transporter superfamily protein YnfA
MCGLCGYVPADMAMLKAAVEALQKGRGGAVQAAPADPADPEANAGGGGGNGKVPVVKSFHKMVDGNGLALMCFAFSTYMFFAFLCNIDGTGNKDGAADVNMGVHFLVDMLEWGVSVGLVIAGLSQGIQGDHLGFTSYIFHAGILGTIGYNFEDMLQGNAATSPYMIGFLCYAAFWFNLVFTLMAFRAATVFGILYAFVAIMFLLVGLNFTQNLDDSANDPTDVGGARIAGGMCGVVAFSCLALLIPVMTGLGAPQVFGLPNPIKNLIGPGPGGDAPAEDGVIESQTKIKLVDANGLALTAFGFSTWMFFAFECNVEGMNWGGKDAAKESHPGAGHLIGMLVWGVPLCLIIAGIFQFLNGDHLGFTSYVFHATILGTTGWWLEDGLGAGGFKAAEEGGKPTGNFYIFSYYYYIAFWINMIFTIMAFRIAKMFGVLYFTVGVMFLVVGLNWSQKLDNSNQNAGKAFDDQDRTGNILAGISCCIVCLQCFYLIFPVMTGLGPLM